MRKEKALITLLKNMVDLLADEAARNPDFARKLDETLSLLPASKAKSKKREKATPTESLPDIHAEWNARGETDFRLWLREQPVAVLRAIIREQDMDASRRTSKWKEAEKLSDHITDSLRARLSRGSAFIGKKSSE